MIRIRYLYIYIYIYTYDRLSSQLVPGFNAHASISGFSLRGRPEVNNELQKSRTRGTAALIGAKLSL